jgi:hypothetical protein
LDNKEASSSGGSEYSPCDHTRRQHPQIDAKSPKDAGQQGPSQEFGEGASSCEEGAYPHRNSNSTLSAALTHKTRKQEKPAQAAETGA